jgi:hypothetical protein
MYKQQTYILRSVVNSFYYLYSDAEALLQRAKGAQDFERTQLSRTALLLFILSLEGLINRVLDHFLPSRVHDFIIDREDRLSFEDKWLLAPLMASGQDDSVFDQSTYPWSHFSELVRLRNDYVHPKHDRPAYYKALSANRFDPLDWNRIPSDSDITEKEIVYRQTRIPKDPYAILPEHVDAAKKVVDDIISALDQFLGGRVTHKNWHHSDQMTLVYPKGAKLADIPADE